MTVANDQGSVATLNCPHGIAVDNVIRVRIITPGGLVSTLAGSGSAAFVDGQGVAASLNEPFGVAVDYGGNLFVADSGNNSP